MAAIALGNPASILQRASRLATQQLADTLLEHSDMDKVDNMCGGGYAVEVPSCSGSPQWTNGYVDNRSGCRKEDDNNTGEVEERDCEEVLSVACSKG